MYRIHSLDTFHPLCIKSQSQRSYRYKTSQPEDAITSAPHDACVAYYACYREIMQVQRAGFLNLETSMSLVSLVEWNVHSRKESLVRRLSTNTCLEFIISIVFLEFIGYTVYSVFTIQQYSLLVQQYPLFSYTCTVYLPVQYIVFSYTVQYIQLYSTVQLSVQYSIQYSIFSYTVQYNCLYSTVYLPVQYIVFSYIVQYIQLYSTV